MTIANHELIVTLDKCFADRRFDPEEKHTLSTLFQLLSREQRAFVRNRAFDLVREASLHEPTLPLLTWLQGVIKAVDGSRPKLEDCESYFSPGDHCLRALLTLIAAAKMGIDVCVFTISDNRISEALIAAHERGVMVRILTDDEKLFDAGSDVKALSRAGITVRTDNSRHHMHHKFVIIDQQRLVTGSFNWTRSASLYNHENLVVLADTGVIADFADEFERLWTSFPVLNGNI